MIERLEYPILYSSDLAKSVDFYVAVLGCEVEENLGDFAEMRLGSSRLAVNLAVDSTKRPGFQTIVVVSDEIESDFVRIAACADVTMPLTETSYGTTFIFLDPDGNKIEVVGADQNS